MPEDPITIPRWVADYLVVPVGLGILAILRWVGSKVLDYHQARLTDLEDRVGELEDKIDRVLSEVEA